MIFSDLELSRKLERTEARANAGSVETRARLEPDSGAEWMEAGGAYAMFDGAESPLTQTFGLGVFEDATDEQLAKIEEFFKDRGAPVFHEVSPMADLSILTLLSERGYAPIELTSVMFQELDGREIRAAANTSVSARPINADEADVWASVAADGWAAEMPELREFLRGMGVRAAQTTGSYPFLAELDGRPVAAGGLMIFDDVCILAGASTLPDARRKGAQSALLAARLSFAAEKGCKFAMMCTAPGSQSQKNAQRNNFQIAYTRIKWQLRN